jgi:hypothetical protein
MADGVNLQPLFNHITNVQQTLSGQIDGVNVQVGQVRSDVQLTGAELRQLRGDFEAYVARTIRAEAVQLSTTHVGNLKAELDREYGHYAVVRRTSVGTLQSFDVGIVSNDTVKSISEELMIQTPRYWLAPALVTLAAWSRDDQETVEKAIQEAYSRDKNKTSLFFTLVMRRQGRLDASVRWLRHYLNSLDPSMLTREFAVVLEASSYEAFGPAGQKFVAEKLENWVEYLRSSGDVIEQQIRRWIGELGISRRDLDTAQYATLSKISPDFQQLQRQIQSASALPEVTAKYSAIKAYEGAIPSALEDLLDDILDTLVTEYDEEELPLRREVLYHDSVIDANGDLDEARARADELQGALEETMDVVSLQTEAAISPDILGVSVHTQRIAIGISIGEFRSAVNRYVTEYRSHALEDVAFKFDANHSNYASTFNFVGVTFPSNTQEEKASESIKTAWYSTMESYIEAARFKPNKYIIGGAVAIGVSILFMFAKPIVGLVLLLIAGAVIGYLAFKALKRAQEAQLKAESTRQDAINDTVKMYREGAAQLVDARNVYHELDDHEPELLKLIDSWPTAIRMEEVA